MNIGDIGKSLYGRIFVGDETQRVKPPADLTPLPQDTSQIGTIREGYAQDKGVIASSKELVEAPQGKKSGKNKKRAGDKVIEKEIKLKSGVTITENAREHTVTISRNDNNGNPQTLAIFDDAELTLPRSSEFGSPLVIENKDMKETITDDGRIELEDKLHGDYEEQWRVYSKWDEWKSDRYVITPDGKVTGAQYDPKPGPFGRNFIDYSWRNIRFVDGQENQDGSITADRGGADLNLRPFLARKYIIGANGQ